MLIQPGLSLARLIVVLFLLFSQFACTQTKSNTGETGPQSGIFSVRSLGKSDINRVMDIYIVEIRAQLRLLMEKLYKRNPRELRKSQHPTAEENIQRVFSRADNWNFRELNNATGGDAIELTFSDSYKGDRVFTFIVGLTSMLMSSYNYKTDFYMYDSIDPQGLYNSARNVELAAWKLDIIRDSNSEPVIYSFSLPGEQNNRSYDRIFGKLTILQDSMAIVIANKKNRTISKVIQRMTTAVFLPIP